MKLGKFKILHGGQFHDDHTLEADFEISKKIALTGESKKGKTTALECFKIILGAIGGEKIIKDLVNRDSNKFDVELPFVGNNKKRYIVKATKSSYYVREEGDTQNIGEPKTFVESHLGKVAADPMKYKNADVDKLIKWLAGFTDLGEEGFEKEYNKQKEAIKKSEDARAAANKEAKARLVLLQDAGYVGEDMQLIEGVWTAAEKKYEKKLDTKELSAKLTAIGNKSDKFVENETKVEAQKARRTQIEAQISTLQKELLVVNGNIEVGEKWLETNQNVKKEYDKVKKDYDNAVDFASEYEAFQTVLRHRKEMYEYEEIAQRADAMVQTAEKKKKEIMWQVIPDVRGAQLILDGTPEQPAGFYVDGFNSRQQSATQYLTAIVKILRKVGVKILVMDDTSTFGTEFINLLNKLSNEGMYLLISEMKRNQELEIQYN